jgi:Ala-tRNA(Pro) deacylase
MPITQLREYLDEHKTKYVSISHSQAFTSQEVAASAHVPGKELAKTVIVRVDGEVAMAVLPASYQINFDLLAEQLGTSKAELAGEQDYQNLFPACELGAMPPFGNLYGMKVYVTESFAEDEEIAFNTGSHTELIKMSYRDFESLVHPRVLKFSTRS